MQNETELLYRISRGDEQAFNELYELYWPKVYAYMESLVKSPETAEELVVDIFVKLWSGREWLEQIQNVVERDRDVRRRNRQCDAEHRRRAAHPQVVLVARALSDVALVDVVGPHRVERSHVARHPRHERRHQRGEPEPEHS